MMNARAPKLRRVSVPVPNTPASPNTTTATTPVAIKPEPTETTGPTITIAAKPISPKPTGATTPVAIKSTPPPEMAAAASPVEAKSSPSPHTTRIEDSVSVPVTTSTATPSSSVLDKDSLFGDESDKEVSPIVSKPESPMDNRPSTTEKGKKRKASDTVSSPTEQTSAAKKIKTAEATSPKSSLSPPVLMNEPPTAPTVVDITPPTDITKKRKACKDVSPSDDNVPSAKKARTSEPSSPRSPSVGIDELLFSTKTASPIPPPTTLTPPTTPSELAPKPIIRRRKAHNANPFRTDLRMGVRGNAAAGTGTVHRQPAPRPARRVTEPDIASPIEVTRTPEEQEALDKLVKTQNKAADKKKPTVVVDELFIDKRMKEALIRSDRSAGKKSRSQGVPKWRKDNPDWKEGSEVDRLISDAIGNKKFMPSKFAGMSSGTKKLVQITSKGEGAAKNMNSRTFSYSRQVDKEKEMEKERERVQKEVELQKEAKVERELDDLFGE